MATMLGADLIVETLEQEGIHHVFSLPGGQLLPIYYAMEDRPKMNTVFCRHEGAATLMATGYSMLSGKPSCVMATVGAGIAYEAGPLFLSWRERLPVLSIAPQVQSWKMKPIQENLQACDQDEIFKPITRFNAIMYHRDRIPALIKRALRAAVAPEPGPVHLDVPVDVMYGFERVSGSKKRELLHDKKTRYEGELFPSRESVAAAARRIASAGRPVVLAGRAVDRARAGRELLSFLTAARVPAIRSASAFAALPAGTDYDAGTAAPWSSDEGVSYLANADLIVLIEPDEETALLCRAVHELSKADVVHVSSNEASLGSIVPDEVCVLGSTARCLLELSDIPVEPDLSVIRDMKWLAGLKNRFNELLSNHIGFSGAENRVLEIAGVMDLIGDLLLPDDIAVAEGIHVTKAATASLKRTGFHNTFLLDDDIVAGPGLPLAVGMKLAMPERRVFLFTEASCFKQHMRELQTMMRYKAGVFVIVFRDRDRKPDEEVDFMCFAESVGVRARYVDIRTDEVRKLLMEEIAIGKEGVVLDATMF